MIQVNNFEKVSFVCHFITKFEQKFYMIVPVLCTYTVALQGQPLGIDIMYLVLADRNIQVRFGLKVVWGS